jgi:hypothetical protein
VTAAPVGPPTASVAAPAGATRVREARLRPEFADRYPGLPAGVWAPAAILADRVLAQALLRHLPGAILGRVLLDEHFEFRFGASRGGERRGLRHRRES